jgi:predicted RNase H-like nuclease (RuvC/YqgF family)
MHAPPTSAINTSLNFALQFPNSQDSELITAEKMSAEIKKLRVMVDALQEQTRLLNETLDVYKKIDSTRGEQVRALSSAIDSRQKIETLFDRERELYTTELNLYKSRVESLEKELSDAKKSKWKSKALSTLLSVGLAYLAFK